MSSQAIFVKGNDQIRITRKFIYSVDVYKIWKKGACLLSSKYYACSNVLNLKKIPVMVKKKGYTIQRFVVLEGAPKEYLIAKGYKQLKS